MKPYKNMPLTEAVQYALSVGITAEQVNARETGRLDKLAKFTGLPLSALLNSLNSETYDFKGLIPNAKRGPLSLTNKIALRDEYSDVRYAKQLAGYLNTSYQNVRLAQRGDFKDKAHTNKPPVNKRTLSLDEKQYIHEHLAHEPTADIARKYNTSYQNVQRAQLGDFKNNRRWVTRTITPEQAVVLGIQSLQIKVPA